MTRFLYGLVRDLHNKAQILANLLNRGKIHQALASDYALHVLGQLERIQSSLTDMAADADLLNSQLLRYNFKKYLKLSREVQLLEAYPLPVILRYTESDYHFFKLGRWMCKQIAYPLPPPIISANSSDYYWAYPKYRLIAVPIGEEFSLLSLGDFYHELAHFLYAQYGPYLTGGFMNDLDSYGARETQRVRDEHRETPDVELFEKVEFEWKEKWIIEFVCDMIATYLVGPAYGWANLKLSAGSLTRFEVFGPAIEEFPLVEHPSDEARMRGIYATLRQLKLEQEIDNLDKKWQHYALLSGSARPADYIFFYPDELLARLAQYVCEGCKNIGLISCTEQLLSTDMNLAVILNTAWNKFLNEPDQYPDWERTQLSEIHVKLESI
jgi:hypothetical protein